MRATLAATATATGQVTRALASTTAASMVASSAVMPVNPAAAAASHLVVPADGGSSEQVGDGSQDYARRNTHVGQPRPGKATRTRVRDRSLANSLQRRGARLTPVLNQRANVASILSLRIELIEVVDLIKAPMVPTIDPRAKINPRNAAFTVTGAVTGAGGTAGQPGRADWPWPGCPCQPLPLRTTAGG